MSSRGEVTVVGTFIARDAVEESVGVATEGDIIAGMDIDLTIGFGRLRSTDLGVSTAVDGGLGVDAALMKGGRLSEDLEVDLVTDGLLSAAFASPWIAPDAQRDATDVTFPPRPPRAERMSYFTSGSNDGAKRRGALRLLDGLTSSGVAEGDFLSGAQVAEVGEIAVACTGIWRPRGFGAADESLAALAFIASSMARTASLAVGRFAISFLIVPMGMNPDERGFGADVTAAGSDVRTTGVETTAGSEVAGLEADTGATVGCGLLGGTTGFWGFGGEGLGATSGFDLFFSTTVVEAGRDLGCATATGAASGMGSIGGGAISSCSTASGSILPSHSATLPFAVFR